MSAHSLPPGTRLESKLEVRRELGSGSFGITYLVRDHDLQQDVVMKEYFPAAWAQRQGTQVHRRDDEPSRKHFEHFLQRFQEEARTAAKLDHPCLVKVHRYFAANGTGYYLMAWHKGEDLQKRLDRQGPMAPGEAVPLIQQVLEGLSELHAAGLIHRDIKPGNIYLRDDGKPILIDFGAARAPVRSKSQQPLTTMYSVGYAPLEQYVLDGNQGRHTDVYAVGAVLYRMLTGTEPLDALTRNAGAETAQRHVPCEIAAPPEVLRSLCRVVDRAMCMEIAARIPDVPTLQAELRAATSAPKPAPKPEPVVSPPPQAPAVDTVPPVQDAPARWRWPLAALVILTLGLSLWYWPRESAASLLQQVRNSLPPGELQVVTQLDPAKPVYMEGDRLAIGFRTAEDAYVAVLIYSHNNEVTLLYPNELATAQKAAAGVLQWVGSKSQPYKVELGPPFGTDQIQVAAFREFADLKLFLSGLQLQKAAENMYIVEPESVLRSVTSLRARGAKIVADPQTGKSPHWGDAVSTFETRARAD